MIRARCLLPLLSCLFTAAARAQEDGWDDRLARSLSGRLAEIDKELAAIRTELPALPAVPVADQGGTGGFAALNGQARPTRDGEFAVDIRLPSAGQVDLVALVPSRRYGVGGLEAQFGTPDEFTVDLLDKDGKALARIADERGVWSDPVRAGHPFVYAVSPPVEAAALRITAGHLRLDSDVSERFVHSWAEAFVFEGERNLARGAKVTSPGGQQPNAFWLWSNEFLVDGQTPLGLPEVPGGEHRNVGWISDGRAKASEAVWLEVDLGEVREFDTVRLFPLKRPTSDLPAGFGFPRRFTVSVLGGPDTEAQVTAVEMDNPGHSPVDVPLGRRRGQKLRIDVSELWKALEHYPAFFALSEVQVLDGEENRGKGAVVRSPDGMGNVIGSGLQYWNMASLSDGFGPDGRLESRRTWLVQLDQRLKLEQKQHALTVETRAIVDRWRRTGLWVFALLGVAGAEVLFLSLPVFSLRRHVEDA